MPATRSYRIGLNTEVTGNGAQIGDLSVRAARLAVEEINAAGGSTACRWGWWYAIAGPTW